MAKQTLLAKIYPLNDLNDRIQDLLKLKRIRWTYYILKSSVPIHFYNPIFTLNKLKHITSQLAYLYTEKNVNYRN